MPADPEPRDPTPEDVVECPECSKESDSDPTKRRKIFYDISRLKRYRSGGLTFLKTVSGPNEKVTCPYGHVVKVPLVSA